MRDIQKIIKYCAMAFAVFLILSIISGITSALISISNVFSPTVNENLKGLTFSSDIVKINIDVTSANILFKSGSQLNVETNNKYIKFKENGNELYITEKNHNWFGSNDDLIVYIPDDLIFEEVSINAEAGNINFANLSAAKLYLDLGAGKTVMDNLKVINSAKINGGAGDILINNGSINNLDLDIEVGKLTLNSLLLGKSKIDSDVGSIDLNLVGIMDDYKIKLDKGLGSSYINDTNMVEDTYYGTGINTIDIEGGIGSVKIKFSN